MNSFSDPIVYLERHTLTVFATSNLSQRQKPSSNDDIIKFFINKGNEGLKYRQPHSCSLCGKVFSRRAIFKEHLTKFHFKTTKKFCDLCSRICFSMQTMRDHMKNSHIKKKFTCNICDYKFATKQDLQRHRMIHATKVECPICQKPVASLKVHMTWHRPKERCLICNEMYAKNNMSTHMKRHVRKAYKCESCEMAFDKKEPLRG